MVKEIISLVRFAHDNDIRLTIKNGGRSYAAYCPNLGRDLSRFKKVEINDNETEVTIRAGCI